MSTNENTYASPLKIVPACRSADLFKKNQNYLNKSCKSKRKANNLKCIAHSNTSFKHLSLGSKNKSFKYPSRNMQNFKEENSKFSQRTESLLPQKLQNFKSTDFRSNGVSPKLDQRWK